MCTRMSMETYMCTRAQVDEVASFVANNARRVLGVEAARVLPVSARSALEAKLASTKESRGFLGASLLFTCQQYYVHLTSNCFPRGMGLSGDMSWGGQILPSTADCDVVMQEAILCLYWTRRAWPGTIDGRGAALASWSPSWWSSWSAAHLQGRACA